MRSRLLIAESSVTDNLLPPFSYLYSMGRPKAFDRKIVLQSAMELFWKKGFHATSMQDLVDHLGIHRASIYEAFENKQGLYEESIKLYREINQKFLQQFLAEQKDTVTGLRKLLLFNLNESLDDKDHKGCFLVNCTSEYLSTNREFIGELLDNKNSFEKIISNFLKKGKKKNEINPDLNIKSFATYLFTFFSGLKVIVKVNSNRRELSKSIDLALQPILP